jgi:FAD/FMN-containing dehydrogenase
VDGAVVIDLINFQRFSMDNDTWLATIGAGTRLGDVAERLHKAGSRAIPQAVCPGIGMGGQATIVRLPRTTARFLSNSQQGGLGPMSRMWGSSLDHVVEVEVVSADGEIQRANSSHNSDHFWVCRSRRSTPSGANVTRHSGVLGRGSA